MYAITKGAYRRKIQAELGLAHAQSKLRELKEKNDIHSEDPAIECRKEIDDLEKSIGETRRRLNELHEAGDQVWEDADEASERIWSALKTAVKNAAVKIKG